MDIGGGGGGASGCNSSSSSVSPCGSSSLVVQQPMSPKSPPGGGGFDLYGKRRQTIKVQALEREIGLLQEEVKFVEGLQPASRCCKELYDFIGAKPDPFIATTTLEIHESSGFWKRLWGRFCLNLRWICCVGSCSLHLEMPNCCNCCCSSNFCCPGCGCLAKMSCSRCCKCLEGSCPHHDACCCSQSVLHHRCTNVNLCSSCSKNCCYSCCL